LTGKKGKSYWGEEKKKGIFIIYVLIYHLGGKGDKSSKTGIEKKGY